MFFVLSIFLLLIVGSSVYIFYRIRPLLPEPGTWQNIVAKIVYILLYVSFFVGYVLQMHGMYALSAPFTVVGSWMLAVILYFVLAFVAIDILRGVNAAFIKSEILSFRYDYGNSNAHLWSLVGSVVALLVVVIGYFNARNPVTKHLVYETDKEISRDFKYILVSDVHLGMINCDKFMSVLRDRINQENVDFVVVAGDFFDGDPYPVVNSGVGEMIRNINTGYGVYAINGNHEWLGNAEIADEFMKKNGITVLRDSVAVLPFGVTIVGREDLSVTHRSKVPRKSVAELMSAVDTSNYIIMLDHQPVQADEVAQCGGVDIELSGHTHAGAQLWPLFVLTRRIYENEYGQNRKGNTDFYTTSGYGTWGPPIRTSARPEIVVVDVKKKNNQ